MQMFHLITRIFHTIYWSRERHCRSTPSGFYSNHRLNLRSYRLKPPTKGITRILGTRADIWYPYLLILLFPTITPAPWIWVLMNERNGKGEVSSAAKMGGGVGPEKKTRCFEGGQSTDVCESTYARACRCAFPWHWSNKYSWASWVGTGNRTLDLHTKNKCS